MPKVSFATQGCRLNHSETASLYESFKNQGYQIVEPSESPDIYVVNTCTVTENADRDTRKLVNRIVKVNERVKIALVGCFAQVKKQALLNLPNVEWVVGNQDKMNLVSIVGEAASEPRVQVSRISNESFTQPMASKDPFHRRANLKIQDGCDNYCAFCIIPFARGPARSRQVANILEEAELLVKNGHQELILTGVNIGTYSEGDDNFESLVHKLVLIDGLKRLRISSIEPTTLPLSIVKLAAQGIVCPYFHIPIQSGNDKILKLMKRNYSIADYSHFVTNLMETLPNSCLGTDVIVGFPGETDDDFRTTYNYLSALPFAYFHVFSYSERSMAISRKFDQQVPPHIIKQRSKQLQALSMQKQQAYFGKFLGKTVPVLFEQLKNGHWQGLTPEFIRVEVQSNEELTNLIKPVKLEGWSKQKMQGSLNV